MAKRSSSKAIKKIDEQLKKLDSKNGKEEKEKVPIIDKNEVDAKLVRKYVVKDNNKQKNNNDKVKEKNNKSKNDFKKKENLKDSSDSNIKLKELETELRCLYNEVNSIVSDFENTKKSEKNNLKNYKVRENKEELKYENNNTVLNKIILVLFIIFMILFITFIGFVIFVSTF